MNCSQDYLAFAGDKPLKVVIVGGSLAGLLHGVMFKRLGHDVHLLEQSRSWTRTNHAAGMGTGPRGVEYFKVHDLCKQPYAFPCPGFQILDRDGRVKRLTGPPLNLTGWDTLYLRLRANFDGLKSEHYPEPPRASETDGKAFYDLGKRATAAIYHDSLVTIEYDNLKDGGSGTLLADLVILADGSNSMIRHALLPQLKNTYSGYVAWRGIVPERDVSESTRRLFDKRFNVFALKRGYIVGYAIPGEHGSLIVGERLFNYVWYYNCPADSQEFSDIMTDTDGRLHATTLPIGKIRPEVWSKLKAHASKVLNQPFLELVEKSPKPFISTIRDCAAPQASFYGGRLLLVGEALTLYRPHTGLSFNQSALDCLQLRRVLQKEMTIHEWEEETLWTQKTTRLMAMVYGEYYQSGLLSMKFVFSALRFAVAMMLSRLARLWKFF